MTNSNNNIIIISNINNNIISINNNIYNNINILIIQVLIKILIIMI